MIDPALRLIEENKRTRSAFLDLGNCGLEDELPDELFECTWLETLNLSSSEWMESKNDNYKNNLPDLEPYKFEKLQELKALYIGYTGISNLSFLKNQVKLTTLDICGNLIREISPLKNLVNLTSLNLSRNQIIDFSVLEEFVELQRLEISGNFSYYGNRFSNSKVTNKLHLPYLLELLGNQIIDFSSIKKLVNLQRLILSNSGISDIRFVENLVNLTFLSLDNNYQISDIGSLKGLVSLTTLSLVGNKISDIGSLKGLVNLTCLHLVGNQISDITPLSNLVNLTNLHVSYNQISDISILENLEHLVQLSLTKNLFNDITVLKRLVNLTSLDIAANQISDISPLKNLVSLTHLDLSYNQVSDITFLEKLVNLTELNLAGNQISNISTIEKLENLTELYLSNNQVSKFNEETLHLFPRLKVLSLQENPIRNIPPAIYEDFDCLKDLRNYFKDRDKESTAVYEAKVILVGNGRVGKTCLVKRLLDNTFNPDEPSTHSIQLRQWVLDDIAEDMHLENVQLNIWDFGGQDIYHATHRFFMRTQALFILVWDVENEKTPEQSEISGNRKKVVYKNHSLLYWLSYIKTESGNSPVIVVQSKSGMHWERKEEPELNSELRKEYNVRECVSIESGKNSGNGFEILKGNIREIVYELIGDSCTEFPKQWYNVRKSIANLQKEGVKQIPLARFHEICLGEDLDESSSDTLLRYLHNTGALFYQSGLFNSEIVIDQKWAIDAVYVLFDPKGYFVKLHGKGRFSGEDLMEAWSQYSEEEVELFISLMLQCEVCFELKDSSLSSFSDREFISPQLLPDVKPESVNAVYKDKDYLVYKYTHCFLQASVIQRFIVRTGFLTETKDIWKQGAFLITPEGMALVEALPENNEVIVRVKGPNHTLLLDKIRNELKEINKGEKEIRESVSLNGTDYVSMENLKSHPEQNKEIQTENGKWVKVTDYLGFLNHDERIRFDKVKDLPQAQIVQDNKPEIFFSYAWDGEKEKIVDALYNSLQEEKDKDGTGKYKLTRDKVELGYKCLISDFLGRIGAGNFVVVAISDKYLKSEYCMFELYELFRNSNLDKKVLLEKIYPIRVEDININKPKYIREYLEYWKNEEREWKELVTDLGDSISPEQQLRYQKVKRICSEFGTFLDLLSDINSLNPAMLSEDNFAIIKKAIEDRVTQGK